MLPTLRPRSLAASRFTSTTTVGLGGFMLVSRSTRPGTAAIFAISAAVRRCSSAMSVPWIDSEIGLLPPMASSRPTWVTVMPATWRQPLAQRHRHLVDAAAAVLAVDQAHEH
jgi:hypothetical protein